MKSFKNFLREKTFHDYYPEKDKWYYVSGLKRVDDLSLNFFALVDGVYGPLYGGHTSFKDRNQAPQSSFWNAANFDSEPDADAVIFGRKTPFGVKIRGIGHDHQKKSKSSLINQLIALLHKEGYWIEASDTLAVVLRAKNAPIVRDIKVIQKLFPNDKITMLADGSYIRGTFHETIFGKPKL
jgi:hypothetical protein